MNSTVLTSFVSDRTDHTPETFEALRKLLSEIEQLMFQKGLENLEFELEAMSGKHYLSLVFEKAKTHDERTSRANER